MKKIFITTIISALILFAKAQTDSTENLLDDVVVTATKSPKKLSETGKVLVVITKEQLEQNSSHPLGEILNRQTGLVVAGSTATPGTNQSVFLRGANAGNTLLLVDGIPVYDASGISSEFGINYLNINQIERIEILKGAQSTLYGSDAVAGVVNIITRKATAKPVSGFANVSAGSFGTVNTAAGINGRLDKFQYNLNGSYVHTNGISSAYDSTQKGDFDKDGFTQYGVNATAAYNISPGFKLNAFAKFSRYDAAIDAGAYIDDNDFKLTNRNALAGLTGEFNTNKNHLIFNYQYNYINRSFVDDSADIPSFSTYQNGLYKSYSHFAEIYDHITISKHTELLLGTDFRHNATTQSYLSVSSFGPYATSLGRDSTNTNQGSFYASFFIKDISGFNAETGGRINNHSVYGWNGTYSINPSYNINNRLKIFVNVASAYHVPSLYQLYSEFGNKDLEPERSQTYEGGVQYTSGKLRSRLVYFKRDIKDVISFYTDPSTYISYYINADKQHDNGLEAEVSYSPVKTVMINANYTYTDGEVKTSSSGKDTTYFNLYRRPHNVFNLDISWQVKQFSFSAKLHTRSFYYEAIYGSLPQKFDGYYTVDLYAEYKPVKNLSLFADVRNVTNQEYFELPGYNSKRFNIMAGVRANF